MLSLPANLPPQLVSAQAVDNALMQVAYPSASTNSYFFTTVQNGGGYTGQFAGWCLDRFVYITPGQVYVADIYDDYSQLPYKSTISFNKINYILNNKIGTFNDIQQAIWHFSDNFPYASLSLNAKTMVDAANAFGASFVPLPGQKKAILLDAGRNTQFTLIEYELPHCIDIDKDGPFVAQRGDTITYTFSIRNCGAVSANITSIQDTVLGDIFNDFLTANGGSSIVTANNTVVFTVDHTLTVCPDPLVNLVTAHGLVNGNPVSDNETHSLNLHFLLGGTVYQDTECDGVFDTDDSAFDNVLIRLYKFVNNDWVLQTSQYTDFFGHAFTRSQSFRT